MPGYPKYTVRGRGRVREAMSTNWSINVANLIRNTNPGNLIGYWPLNDTTGTSAAEQINNNAGTYAGTFTLASNPFGNKNYASFGGGRVSLATPLSAINTLFNTQAGTIACWIKMLNAGVWTDATARVFLEFGADANNRVFIQKTATNNQLQWSHRAGGTAKNVTLTTSAPLTWFHVALTWNKTADTVKAYFNGLQTSTTQTSLGVWAGNLASGFTALADFSSAGSSPHSGYAAHCVLYKADLSDTDIARLYIPRFAT